ncbi:MAG: hypothetical protein II220_04065, partial [Spirochaetales bacterium]|nr:hypothetical protein [Spirochaetales bacterium]
LGKKIDVVVSKSKGRITGDASSKTAQLERVKQELIRQVDSPSFAFIANTSFIFSERLSLITSRYEEKSR